MGQTANCSIVRRTIDLHYANKQRAASLKWLLVNGALLVVLVCDLGRGCGGCLSAAAWAEALGACVLAASCVQHACRLARAGGRAAPAAALSPRQQRLLGLKDSDLDSSFVVRERARAPPPREEEPGSLSPARSWRAADSPPPSPPSPGSPGGAPAERASPDLFISDGRALAAYIRQQEARAADGAGGERVGCVLPAAAAAHQLAVLPERGAKEPGGEEGDGAGGSPLWRRLHVDPQRLTEYNYNLRLWLQVTVVGRVTRELEAAQAAGVSLAGVGAGGGGGARADALLPFLRPFADRQYVADRIKDLSRGGCLSAFRWDGGGRGWSEARPSDAELLLHLLAAYLDLVVPGGDFSARHVSAAPAPPARPLALHRLARSPPHYALVLGDETIELPRGRNNLLHTVLLFLAAAARGSPPALCRLHLGAAGLNMLWILGR